MASNVCVTAVDGNTGFLIAELILTDHDCSEKVKSVTGLTIDPESVHAQELKQAGASIVRHTPGRARQIAKTPKDSGCDTICLIPPALFLAQSYECRVFPAEIQVKQMPDKEYVCRNAGPRTWPHSPFYSF